ncbi:MAG: hypothetical protein ACYCWW_20275 [Deltaproteobacteria bacterium]
MASLSNSKGSLRFSLELAALESGPVLGRTQAASELAGSCEAPAPRLGLPIVSEAPPPRLLAATSMDFHDQKDGEFWPFVRYAVLWLGPSDPEELCAGLERLLRDEIPGFAFRSAEHGTLGLQVGKLSGTDAASTVYAVEVGIDLAGVLDEAGGAGNPPGESLALFRFQTGRSQLVAFARALSDELSQLRPASAVTPSGERAARS